MEREVMWPVDAYLLEVATMYMQNKRDHIQRREEKSRHD